MSRKPALRHSYSSALFDLNVSVLQDSTLITMQVHSAHVTTRRLPKTTALLKLHCPTVLKTKCFNEENLPFRKEVRDTEIGHLFEHMLLDFLCKEAIAAGANEALYKGDTSWDWNVAARGSFEITISLGMEEEKLLKKALPKAIAVTETILSSGTAADRSMKTPQVTSKNSLSGHVHKPALAALVHPVKMKRPDNF